MKTIVPRVLAALLAALLITACAERGVPPESRSESAAVSGAESSPPEPKVVPALAFVAPDAPHWILGECAFGDGYLAVYEEEHPDEYNKQFSQDTIFHALRWQLFDAEGKWLSTGDSAWGNGFPIHDLPISALRPGDGTVSFDVRMPEEYEGAVLNRTFLLVIDDAKLSLLGRNPNDNRYSVQDWRPFAERDGATLEQRDRYNRETGADEMLFRLTLPSGEAKIVEMGFSDQSFWSEMNQLIYPDYVGMDDETPVPSALKVTFDPAKETAELSIPKLTVSLDFAAGTSTVSRHYTADQLQTKLATSPDGKYSIYTVGEFTRFEASGGCDYVSVGPDGEIHFLYAGADMDMVAFAGDNTIVANTYDTLTFYDPVTGLPSQAQPQFDYGEVVREGAPPAPKVLTVGLAVDADHQRILAAYRLNTFGGFTLEVEGKEQDVFPVSLAVLDFSGALLAELDTELEVAPFGKFTIIPVEITLMEGGTASLMASYSSEPQQKVTVSYPIG